MRQLLRDIAEIGAGQGAPQGDSNYCTDGIPFVKAGNMESLTSGGSLNDILKVSERVARDHKLKLYPKGTVLFAKSGMSCLKGYVYVLPQEAYVVSHLACITPKEDISDYLRFYFDYHRPNQLVKDPAYPSISLADIGALEIDTKDAKSRERIISVLHSVEAIIESRKQQLSNLDDLIKARFVEMFGDPNINPKGQMMTVQTAIERGVIEKPFDGNHGEKHPKSSEYVEKGIPFLMANNICDRTVDQITCSFITHERAMKLDKGFARDMDVLITHKGTIGRTAVLHTGYEFVMLTPQVAAYRVKEGVLPDYLCGYFETDFFQNRMKQLAASGGSTRAYAGITAQLQLELMIPPIEKQGEFVKFVHQVDKSKVAVQKALDEAQILFDSLMQQYFG